MDMIAGRYQQEDEIGSGAMGTVYRGLDTLTGEPVAIKHLKPEAIRLLPNTLERFAREAGAMQQLSHPNIVRVLAMVQDADSHYLIMEYVGGGSLAHRLEREPRLPVTTALSLTLDLVDALGRAHRFGIIHRDVKPANILLTDSGSAKLTDFGEVHLVARTRITMSDEYMGTLHYLSPESLRNEPPDAAVDLWASGVMLYEMLAGEKPFTGKTAKALIEAIMRAEPSPLNQWRDDCPDALVDLMAMWLHPVREDRLTDAREAGARLLAILETL